MSDESTARPLTLGALIFDGVEPLDLFGPLEMWMNLGPELVSVWLIAETTEPVAVATVSWPTDLAPRVVPHYSIDDAPPLDLILVPGGIGTVREVGNPRLIEWLSQRGADAMTTASVCTGAQLLARAGLLDDQRATTNKVFFSYVASFGRQTEWVRSARYVDEGKVATSSGVSAGIDLSLALIARLFGIERAEQIAAGAEYAWNADPDDDPFDVMLDQGMPFVDTLQQLAAAER